MASFKYKARNPAGEEREGTVEASNIEAGIDVLQKNNLILVSIVPEQKTSFFQRSLGSFKSVKTQDLVIFTRQLSTLFGAKVPAVQALRTLSNESQNRNFRAIIVDVVDRVAGGMNLSGAFGEHPDVFSSFFVNLVKSGEESGRLEETFDFLAGYLERAEYLASKAKNALIYPGFILGAFVVVLIVMFVYVVPQLLSILKDTGQVLPWYTKIMVFISGALVNYGAYLLILFLIVGFLGWRFLRTEPGMELWDRLVLLFPVIGGLYRKIYLSRITDNLATLFVGGIPILNALKITSEVVDNRVYKKILLDAIESVRGGSTISASFDRYEDIPPLVTQMIKIGEETGKLDFILNKISAYYRQEVDNILSNLVSLIEPVLIVSLGLGVAFVVAAIFIPLYGVTSSI